MEPITLITTAIAMVTPFVLKTGEAIAQKIGGEIWELIKKPFAKEKVLEFDISNEKNIQELVQILSQKIESDPKFREELQSAVEKGQKELNAYYQQNIINEGHVEKQINIQSNTGNITM